MEDFERTGMIDSMRCRRDGEPIEYEAPGAEKKWRARDLLDIHWNLTGINCPVSFNRILSCIVGHANPTSGICYPRHSTIAIETGYSVETVRRAVRWWKKKQFLTIESRGLGRALAYHPQWALLESFWVAVTSDIDEQKSPVVTKGTIAVVTKGNMDGGQYADQQNLKVVTPKGEPHPERAQSPSAPDAHVISFSEGKKEEGNQGEQEVCPSLLPEGLSYGQAQEIVSRYCTGHHWQHLTQPDLDAAIAAEIVAPGSGRAIVDVAADKNAKEAANG